MIRSSLTWVGRAVGLILSLAVLGQLVSGVPAVASSPRTFAAEVALNAGCPAPASICSYDWSGPSTYQRPLFGVRSRLARAAPLAALAAVGAAEDASGTILKDAAESCSANSFTATTLVTMADGSKRPISRIRIGDLVLATDPETGASAARPVTALILHTGRHVMVDVTLADGSVITATDRHPFWDATTASFTYADNLHAGDALVEADGIQIRVAALRVYREDVTAYNLTVDGIHTYYAGPTSVLVHNSCFQMNREIAQGARGTRGIDRVDRADPENGAFQDHVHFSDHDGTLNRDGTWGHEGEGHVTNAQRRWLGRWGWGV